MRVGGAVCLDPCLPGLNSVDSKFMAFYNWLCGTNGVMSSNADGSSSLFPCDLLVGVQSWTMRGTVPGLWRLPRLPR